MKRMLIASLIIAVSVTPGAFAASHLNEFSSSPDTVQWVELANPDTVPLIVSGWQIITATSSCVLNCTIPAGGFLIVDSAKLAAHAIGDGEFRLNPTHDHIILAGPDERVLYPATPTDRYHSRTPPAHCSASFYEQDIPDGTNYNWYIDSTPTPGRPNDDWSAVTGQLIGAPDANVTVTLTGINGIFRCDVAPGDSFILRGLGPGDYLVSARAVWQQGTYVDTFRDQLTVGYAEIRNGVTIGMVRDRWETPTPVPAVGQSGRWTTVRDGGCLAYLAPHIYLLKGHTTLECWRYVPNRDIWTQQPDVPIGSGLKVGRGGAMTVSAGHIYASKGSNSLDFLRFDPASGWLRVANLPVKSKDGAALAGGIVGDTACVYLLRGARTQEFWRYNITADSWQIAAPAPAGLSGKAYGEGSCLTSSDDGHRVYALKGSYNEFYAYSARTGQWSTLAYFPLIGHHGKKRKVGSGAALTFASGSVYALKGGRTLEFWRFDTAAGTWSQLPDLDAGAGRSVYSGGALAYATGDTGLYALKGNSTDEFYRFPLRPSCFAQPAAYRAEVQSNKESEMSDADLQVNPNPVKDFASVSFSMPKSGALRIALYDISGKGMRTAWAGQLDAGKHRWQMDGRDLVPGVYVLRLTAGSLFATRKLVIGD